MAGRVIFCGVTYEPRPYRISTWIARKLNPTHETEGTAAALLRVKLADALQEIKRLNLAVAERDRIIAASHCAAQPGLRAK